MLSCKHHSLEELSASCVCGSMTLRSCNHPCRNPILEALIQLLMVPNIKLMDRGLDKDKYTFLLTRCLVKASRILPERYKVSSPSLSPCVFPAT